MLSRPAALAERIERAHALDPVIHGLSDSVVRALPAGARTDALHGVPFGQPAHPALVRLPLGCWTSAVLLDLFRGTERAAGMLIAAGIAATAPAAATGLADWSALHEDQQRVGLVHAVCQGGAASLFLGSLAARAGGRTGYGRALSTAGLTVATVGAYLGGHLALRLGAGTSHAEQVSHLSATRLARPVRAGRTARPAPGPAPARLPVPARVPAGSRGQRAVRPVLPSRRAPASGPDRRGARHCLRRLPLARIHLRDRRRHASCTGPPPPVSHPSRPA